MAGNLFGLENDHLAADPEDTTAGVSCLKKIILVFGLLLLLAALFIPYRVKSISYETNPQTRLIMRRIFYDRGCISLPGYMAAKEREPVKKDEAGEYLALDVKILTAEFSLIIFLGIVDYLIFCLFLRKTRRSKPESENKNV